MPLFSAVSAGGVPKATYTGTTGSPNINTAARPGKTIINYTGSGTITIGTAGTVELLLVGAGGGGYGSAGQAGPGGGGGGNFYSTSAFLSAGTWNVYVGAGGDRTAAGTVRIGEATSIYFSRNLYIALPGSGGGTGNDPTRQLASTGGQIANAAAVQPTYGNNQGFAGGTTPTSTGNSGGGGGAGAVGANGTTSPNAAGNGGAGFATSITGTSITYGGGGGGNGAGGTTNGLGGAGGGGNGAASNSFPGSAGGNGAANTGGGGGGSGYGQGGLGGSGRAVIVIG
jgi:hypothetical protein